MRVIDQSCIDNCAFTDMHDGDVVHLTLLWLQLRHHSFNMHINANTVLRLEDSAAVLVPYTESHVKVYHAWMGDAELLRLTCSERLSLEEEFSNMKSWREDPKKLTFIVLDAARNYAMAGDVNLYLNGEDGEGEIEVMIAETASRRRGIASAACRLMATFAFAELGVSTFIAKVLEDNSPSISLLEKIGFTETCRISAFKEVHLVLDVSGSEKGKAMIQDVKRKWSTESYVGSSLAERKYSQEQTTLR